MGIHSDDTPTKKSRDLTLESGDTLRPEDDARPSVNVGAGDLVGVYRLRDCIGEGGMGQVWRAEHKDHGRPVAVKLIYKSAYESAPHAVTQEFKLLAKMRHDHIVVVLDSGLHDDRAGLTCPYIVMEYVPGARRITQYVEEEDVGPRERSELFLQACRAIAFVHDAGDIHLDIKPDNILVDVDGKVLLSDFGLARPALGWYLHNVGGTPGFMPLEQLEAQEDLIGKHTDVWSIGATLFRLLTGEDAHGLSRHPSRQEQIEAARKPPRPLRAAAPALKTGIPELIGPLDAIIDRCMQPGREQRYRDAREVADALDTALRARSVRRSVRHFAQRRPRLWTCLILATIAVIATAVAGVVTTPILTRWNEPLEWFGASLPPPQRSLQRLTSFPDVTIIEFDTETARTLMATDELRTLEPSRRRSYRQMHAEIIPRLVEAGAEVIVFDIYFPTESPHDEKLAAAIRAARARGVSVVLGVKTWRLEDGRPEMSPALWSAGPLWGGLTLDESAGHLWTHLLIEREGAAPMPSLSSAAYFAFRVPDTSPEISVEDGRIIVQPYRPAPERPEHHLYVGDPFTITPSARKPYEALGGTSAGLMVDDVESFNFIKLPDDASLAASTIRYEEVWSMPLDILRRQVGENVTIILDVDEKTKIAGHPAGRVHAASIQSLILDYRSRVARWLNVPLTLLGAIVGVSIAWLFRRRTAHATAAPGTLTALTGLVLSRLGQALLVLIIAVASAALVVLVVVAWCTHMWFGLWMYPMPGLMAGALAGLFALLITSRIGSELLGVTVGSPVAP